MVLLVDEINVAVGLGKSPTMDVSSGATLRAPKVISAIWDALGRHAYTIIR